jgi:hypothetical protein
MAKRRKPLRRTLDPLPINGLADHPVLMTCPCAVYGIVLRLLIHYQMTRCVPLPDSDHELAHIARAHLPTWRRWKPKILEVIADLTPEIEGQYRKAEGRRKGLRNAAYSSHSTQRLNAMKGDGSSKSVLAQRLQAEVALTPKLDANVSDRPPPIHKRPARARLRDRV